MDDVEALLAYITRTATSDIGSLFSWKKDTEDYSGQPCYYLLWGSVSTGTFYIMNNYLYLHMGTKHINNCPKVDMSNPEFDISPIINELRGMVKKRDEQLKSLNGLNGRYKCSTKNR